MDSFNLLVNRYYLDSCIVIYLVERHPRFFQPIHDRIAENLETTFCVSELTRLEVLTRPHREGDTALAQRYERSLDAQEHLAVNDSILRAALDWRIAGLKTPDALHPALARHHGCGAFWTNDDRLARAAAGWSDNVLKSVEP